MAHQIYKKEARANCPRCQCKTARLQTFHFGVTYMAECLEAQAK